MNSDMISFVFQIAFNVNAQKLAFSQLKERSACAIYNKNFPQRFQRYIYITTLN